MELKDLKDRVFVFENRQNGNNFTKHFNVIDLNYNQLCKYQFSKEVDAFYYIKKYDYNFLFKDSHSSLLRIYE